MKNLPNVGGIYQHYKDATHLYLVLGFTRHSETSETLVTYLPLYELPWLKEEDINYSLGCSRPLDLWNSLVVVDGVERPRFKEVALPLANLS